MNEFIPNDWSAIRTHYALNTPAILAAAKNEWAIDAYAWDQGRGIIRMTPIEAWLWHDIRAVGAVLYPQYPVSRVFVDFANPRAKVAIECDGKQYHNEAKDAERDRILRAHGWTVYRISGKDCRTAFDYETRQLGAAEAFVREIADRHGLTP